MRDRVIGQKNTMGAEAGTSVSSIGRGFGATKSTKKTKSDKLTLRPKTVFSYKELEDLIFKKIDNEKSFNPKALSPLPESLRLRHEGSWWVRCASGDLIEEEVCYNKFLDINALYQKNHPCWNCKLGKEYRQMRVEDSYIDERIDNLVQ